MVNTQFHKFCGRPFCKTLCVVNYQGIFDNYPPGDEVGVSPVYAYVFFFVCAELLLACCTFGRDIIECTHRAVSYTAVTSYPQCTGCNDGAPMQQQRGVSSLRVVHRDLLI